MNLEFTALMKSMTAVSEKNVRYRANKNTTGFIATLKDLAEIFFKENEFVGIL